jgi:hypothetical protein
MLNVACNKTNRSPHKPMTREKKQKILLLIPIIIIAALLIWSWASFLLTDMTASWRHYLALGLFAVLVYLYRKSFTKTIIATGIYLLLATLNVLSMTPANITAWNRLDTSFGSIETPHFQILSLTILIIYLILNFDTLFNMYLDYKEAKSQQKK